jgi:hypothetical protein
MDRRQSRSGDSSRRDLNETRGVVADRDTTPLGVGGRQIFCGCDHDQDPSRESGRSSPLLELLQEELRQVEQGE